MAYDLHIERADESPIALSEWRAAIEATEGVRLFAAAAHTVTNPKTGELISSGAREGDTEVFFPDSGEWHSVFRWRGESAVFAARFDPTETSHPAWKAAVSLATRLGAVIRGDEGEVYDFETGEVTDALQRHKTKMRSPRGLMLWATSIVLVYVLSLGPADFFLGEGSPTVRVFYAPLGWADKNIPPFHVALNTYMKLWNE